MQRLLYRFVVYFVLCGMGFLGTAAIIHAAFTHTLDPFRLYAENRSEKLGILANTSEKFVIASFGSSRVHTAFDPRVFDKTLADHGIPDAKSLNLAVVGGSQTEQYAMASRFIDYLEVQGITRAIIILELSAGLNLQNQHLIHPRAINLYDADVAAFGATFTESGAGVGRLAGRAAYVSMATALHHLNVGFLSSATFTPSDSEAIMLAQFSEDRRGFLPRTSDAYREVIQKIFSERPALPAIKKFTMQPGYSALIEKLAQAATRKNTKLQFVYVVVPTLAVLSNREDFPTEIQTSAGPVPVIDFSSVPELLTPACWNDRGHLSASGAVIFSRLLAERIATSPTIQEFHSHALR